MHMYRLAGTMGILQRNPDGISKNVACKQAATTEQCNPNHRLTTSNSLPDCQPTTTSTATSSRQPYPTTLQPVTLAQNCCPSAA
jgi:hypothetical protein